MLVPNDLATVVTEIVRESLAAFRYRTAHFDILIPLLGKAIMDDIDRTLGEHLSLSADEVDFILNYDVKYRMGADSGDGQEETAN